jgi:hypothetical protein
LYDYWSVLKKKLGKKLKFLVIFWAIPKTLSKF